MPARSAVLFAIVGAALAALTTAHADTIDDDIALFDGICLSNMPKLEPVRARAKAEGWPEVGAGALQTPNSVSAIPVQQAWLLDANGQRYTVRIGEGRSKLRVTGPGAAASGKTLEGDVARCSLETQRGDGREILQRVEKKFGPGKGPFLPFLSPKGSVELDHQWSIKQGELQLMLMLYRPSAEQQPGARLEIVLNVNPFAGK